MGLAARNWTLFVMMALILGWPAGVNADEWALTFGGVSDDTATSIRRSEDDGCIVVGDFGTHGSGGWVLKLDAAGGIEWQRLYGSGAGLDCSLTLVRQTDDLGYLLGGGYGSTGIGDLWLVKLDAAGDIAWQKSYGGPATDTLADVRQTTDLGFVLAATTESFGAGSSDILVMKLDNAGNPQWQKVYGGSDLEAARSIGQTADGGFVVAGVTNTFDSGNIDFWVLKLNPDGTINWEKAYGLETTGNENIEGRPRILQAADGGFLLAGSSEDILGSASGAWILKLAADGTIDWQKTYPSIDSGVNAILETTGGFVVAGETVSSLLDPEGYSTVLKLDSTGSVSWGMDYGNPQWATELTYDRIADLDESPDGGFLLAGRTETYGVQGSDLWVLKTDPAGQIPACESLWIGGGVGGDTTEVGIDSSATVADVSLSVITTTVGWIATDALVTDGCERFAGSLAGLARTGQDSVHASGDDGDLRAGVVWPNPRFDDQGDGTIRDLLTGLVWVGDGNLMPVRDPGFDTDGGDDGKVTWGRALAYVDLLNIEGYLGHADWRLPNIIELESLVNAEATDQAAWLNGQGFTNVQTADSGGGYDAYWSSTSSAGNYLYKWAIYMDFGQVSSLSSNGYFFVFPVREGQDGAVDDLYPANLRKTGQKTSYSPYDDGDLMRGVTWPSIRFEDNSDGTVTDHLTGLMWLKDADCFGFMNWQGALDTVADFNLAPTGYDCIDYDEAASPYRDWRLPNRRELLSLIDYSQWQPALPAGHQFVNPSSLYYYWSSTTQADYPSYAWDLYLRTGLMDDTPKSSPNPIVWPVRSLVPTGTVDADLVCLPAAGTVPFTTTISVTLANRYGGQTRRIAAHIDATIAAGTHYPNWRAGFTNVAAGDAYTIGIPVTIPALGTVIGDNLFQMIAEDVTPSPYNQLPYPPSGDTDTASCTVTGIAP